MKHENLTMRYLYAWGALLVLLGHCDGGGLRLFDSVLHYGAFHLAIFVFGAGYFAHKLPTFWSYAGRRVRKLLLPLWGWNIFYALVLFVLRIFGVTFGTPLSFRSMFLYPVYEAGMNVLNLADWFVWPFFCVQLIYGLVFSFCARMENEKKQNKAEVLCGILLILLGMTGMFVSNHGFHIPALYPVFRVCYFLPFHVFGRWYRLYGEAFLKKVPPYLYSGLCLLLATLLTRHFGRPVYVIPSSCDYPFGVAVSILSGLLGIGFWMGICEVLAGKKKPVRSLLSLGRHSADLMHHQFFGFFLWNLIAYLLNSLHIVTGFSKEEFLSDIWYLYLPVEVPVWKLTYVCFAVLVSYCMAFLSRKAFWIWDRLVLSFLNLPGKGLPEDLIRSQLEENESLWKERESGEAPEYIRSQKNLSAYAYGTCSALSRRLFFHGEEMRASHNSCEVIAVYNVLLALSAKTGSTPSFPALLSAFSRHGIHRGGCFGTSPKAILDYLKKEGFTVTTVKKKDYKSVEAPCILVLFNRGHDPFSMIHTMAYVPAGSSLKTSGILLNDGEGNREYPSVEAAVNGYHGGEGAPLLVLSVK